MRGDYIPPGEPPAPAPPPYRPKPALQRRLDDAKRSPFDQAAADEFANIARPTPTPKVP